MANPYNVLIPPLRFFIQRKPYTRRRITVEAIHKSISPTDRKPNFQFFIQIGSTIKIIHAYLPICSRILMIRYLLLNPSASPVLRATILIKISSMTAVRLIPFIHPNSIAPTPLLLQKLLHTFYPLLWLIYHCITMGTPLKTHNPCFRIIFFHKSCRLFGKDFVCLCPVNK